LSYAEVSHIIASFGNKFEDKRNKAIIMILVDCGLRLGELLKISIKDIDLTQQLMKVDGKTGERVVRYGQSTAKVLMKYLKIRQSTNGHNDRL